MEIIAERGVENNKNNEEEKIEVASFGRASI